MEKKVDLWNKKTLSFIGALVLILIIIIITIQNTREVQMSLLFWQVQSSLILLIFISFLVGALTTLLVLMPTLSYRDPQPPLRKPDPRKDDDRNQPSPQEKDEKMKESEKKEEGKHHAGDSPFAGESSR